MTLTPHVKRVVIPIHLLGLFAVLYFFLTPVSASWLLATFVGWFMISGLGVAIGLHRLLSHRAFQTTVFVKRFLAYLGCLGAQGSPLFWVSLHRGIHHPFADTVKDIHSPVLGKWNSYMGWQFTLKPSDVPFRAAIDLSQDSFIRFLHKRYYSVFWGTVIAFALINVHLALFGLILPMIISIHAENLVDLFCHLPDVGYRNYPTKDQSANVVLLGLFSFGQGWHNNHHARPNDYNFGGNHWWEFDICKVIVPMLAIKSKTREVLIAK